MTYSLEEASHHHHCTIVNCCCFLYFYFKSLIVFSSLYGWLNVYICIEKYENQNSIKVALTYYEVRVLGKAPINMECLLNEHLYDIMECS
jgi:hypothetical protein